MTGAQFVTVSELGFVSTFTPPASQDSLERLNRTRDFFGNPLQRWDDSPTWNGIPMPKTIAADSP